MKTRRQRHLDNCSAPICACDPNPNYKEEVVWCPGEGICKWKPYQKFQLTQIKINDLYRKGKVQDGTYSAQHLEALKISKTGRISGK
jgi:hypothetical protein